MKPRPAADFLESLSTDLEDALLAAMDETTREAHRLAIEYSSGSVTTAQLRREDHPFARRHGAPQRDPSIINAQTGRFREAWEVEEARWDGDALLAGVVNESAVADYLGEGTAVMFRRPLVERVEREIEPVLEENLVRAVRSTLG